MSLPDELWRLILELGVETSSLTYKDICCLSMASRRLNHLSKEDSIWSKLLSSDFPTLSSSSSSSSTSTPPKSIYQTRFEKDKAKKLLAEKRAVLRLESQIHEHTRKVHEIEHQLGDENEKIKSAIDELKNLQKVKEASSALKVWQPEIVHGRHRQIVEHCSVPVDSRINVLDMEIKLCRQQMIGFLKARREEKGRLEMVKEKLLKVKYRSFECLEGSLKSNVDDESRKCRKILKKVKRVE
ncbi:F-box protein SKIP24 isoform X1 [Lactuca sativa]|nr:F-box protein SKIP24 isoform X1 [Lactuca sativa]XP_023734112.1 F-box protein SKIP24 isoform X1 [Lactuca sativa]